ncbi:MAG: hypothetical protein EA350_03050 [Gemmatimonadales bacterium]|nr:MAG: hypothetical protein EA350_03050 [Gemmatimonadales bacterium]
MRRVAAMNRAALLQAAAFLLVGAVLWMGLEGLSRAHPPTGWDQVLLDRMDTVVSAPDSVRVLVIGNSHAGAIDPDDLDRGSVALPFPWNDLAEAEHQVRTLVPRLPELRVALVAVSFFTFHWANDDLESESLLDSRERFHAVSPGWGTVEGDLESLLRGKSYWIVRPDHWLGVASGLASELGGGSDDAGDDGFRDEVRPDSALARHAGERVTTTVRRKREMIAQNPDLPRENHERLVGIIDELQGAGVCVVLFTPPYHWRYLELYEAAPSLAEMRALTSGLSDSLGVPWLDYSHHPMSREPIWFADSDHLNIHGDSHFTGILMEEVGDWCGSR